MVRISSVNVPHSLRIPWPPPRWPPCSSASCTMSETVVAAAAAVSAIAALPLLHSALNGDCQHLTAALEEPGRCRCRRGAMPAVSVTASTPRSRRHRRHYHHLAASPPVAVRHTSSSAVPGSSTVLLHALLFYAVCRTFVALKIMGSSTTLKQAPLRPDCICANPSFLGWCHDSRGGRPHKEHPRRFRFLSFLQRVPTPKAPSVLASPDSPCIFPLTRGPNRLVDVNSTLGRKEGKKEKKKKKEGRKKEGGLGGGGKGEVINQIHSLSALDGDVHWTCRHAECPR